MKTLILLTFLVICGFVADAQNESPISHISKQVTNYFSLFPTEKVFLTTDKE